MEFHEAWGVVAYFPRDIMEPQVLFKCCSNVPWNSGEISMEIVDQKHFN